MPSIIVGVVVLVAGVIVAVVRVRQGQSVKSSIRRVIPMTLIGLTVAATVSSLFLAGTLGILALATAAVNFVARDKDSEVRGN
jgi:hypothetical protein